MRRVYLRVSLAVKGDAMRCARLPVTIRRKRIRRKTLARSSVTRNASVRSFGNRRRLVARNDSETRASVIILRARESWMHHPPRSFAAAFRSVRGAGNEARTRFFHASAALLAGKKVSAPRRGAARLGELLVDVKAKHTSRVMCARQVSGTRAQRCVVPCRVASNGGRRSEPRA